MSVGKDRVFLLSAIAELKTAYEQLFQAAKEFSTEAESKAKGLQSLLGQVPSEAKSSQLSGSISGLKLEKDEFQELLDKLTRDVEKLQNDLPALDQAAAANVNDLQSAADQLASLFKEYQSFIKGGFTAQDVNSFKKSLSKMRMQNGMRMSDIDKTLQRVLDTSKGLAVVSAYYSKDPVNLTTGNFSADKEDLTVHGEVPLVFKRTYNAMDEYRGALGEHWVHSFEVQLYPKKKEGQLKVMMEDGNAVFYEEREENHYVAPMFPAHQLVKTAAGYQLTLEDQTVYSFNLQGQWIQKEMENGQKILLSYNSQNQLKKVSSLSGYLRFRYHPDGYLSMVKDQTNRKLQFSYANNCLIKVTGVTKETLRYQYNDKKELLTLTNPRGIDLVQNTYDYLGRTTRQVFPDGGVMTYAYEDEQKTITVTEQNGNQVTYYRDKQYRNTRAVYADGEEVSVYNGQNQLVAFTDKRGNKTQYSYDERGNQTNITNALGETVTLTYDEQNHPIQIRQANGGTFRFCYEDNQLVEVKNPLNHTSSIRYDEQKRPIEVRQPDGSQLTFTYDERGNIQTIGQPNGSLAHYVYDERNQVIQTTDPNGNDSQYSYDEQGNLLTITNAAGATREYTYNEINKITQIKDFDGTLTIQEYNNLGKIEKVVNSRGGITELEYDLMWNISKIRQPNGAETLFQYNQLNQLVKTTNALGHSTMVTYDAVGNPLEIVGPSQSTRSFRYDALNRPTKVVDASGHETRYTYDRSGKIASIMDSKGQTTAFRYDAIGQLVEQVNPLGHKTRFTYTALGKVAAVEDPNGGVTTYDYYPGGKLKTVQYPAGETIQYTYDNNENVIEKQVGMQGPTHYSYDRLNQITAITNPLGHTKKFSYDEAGRVVLFQDETGAITEYDYLPTGELAQVRDALGNVTSYSYDEVGNLIQMEQPTIDKDYTEAQQLNRRTMYHYDLLGNVTQVIDALGNEESYRYDEENHLIEKIDKDGFHTRLSYTETGRMNAIRYDDGKEVQLQYNELRQLVAVQDWLGKTTMELDALGRILQLTTPDDQQLRYEWDALGNRTKLIYPDGKEAAYTYDSSSKLTRLRSDQQEYTYRYNERGQLIEKQQPAGLTSSYQYDAAYQLTELVHQQHGEVLEHYQYHYNEAGNKTHIEKQRKGLLEESGQFLYHYDPLQRLTEVQKDGDSLRRYTYDAFGNRIAKSEKDQTTHYTYNALNQLIHQEQPNQSRTMRYDKRGNLVEELLDNHLHKSFEFDATNMMTKVIQPTVGEATYDYNGLRNRVGQTIVKADEPLKQIQYVLDLTKPYNNLLERKVNEDTESYLWDNQLLAMDGEEQFLLDELGSPLRQLTAGGSQELFAYDEFGVAQQSQAGVFGFTGYQQDEISGLNYAQARYYNQEQGRFISEDNIKGFAETPQTLNPYVYVWNQPMKYVDRDGNLGFLAAVGIGALVGGVVGGVSQLAVDVVKNVDNVVKGEKLEWSKPSAYIGAVTGGALAGATTVAAPILFAASTTVTAITAGVVGGISSNATSMLVSNKYEGTDYSSSDIFESSLISGGIGGILGGVFDKIIPSKYLLEISGINKGRNSMVAVFKSGITRMINHGHKMSWKTIFKGLLGNFIDGLQEEISNSAVGDIYEYLKESIIKRMNEQSEECLE
ncbi:DUF6531 domain-containing protein [Enterococcus sp. LJL128]